MTFSRIDVSLTRVARGLHATLGESHMLGESTIEARESRGANYGNDNAISRWRRER